MIRTGWIMTGLFVLFMAGASVAPKLLGAQVAVDSLIALDWPPRYLMLIGLIEFACVILFIIPATALPGAVLTTALLGTASAVTQSRHQSSATPTPPAQHDARISPILRFIPHFPYVFHLARLVHSSHRQIVWRPVNSLPPVRE